MDGPPTVLSRMRNGGHVFAALLLGLVLYGTDLGKKVGPSPRTIWEDHVLKNLGSDDWSDDHPIANLSPPRYGAKAWLFVAGMIAYTGLRDLKSYPLTTVGTARRVDTYEIDDGEHEFAGPGHEHESKHDPHCTVCGDRIDDGEHRQYADQWVLFGIPITNREWGQNDYCRACAGPEATEETIGDHEVGLNEELGSESDAWDYDSDHHRERETEIE